MLTCSNFFYMLMVGKKQTKIKTQLYETDLHTGFKNNYLVCFHFLKEGMPIKGVHTTLCYVLRLVRKTFSLIIMNFENGSLWKTFLKP